jgi:FlaG/FlaF family flagellin (archaellin)
MKLLTSLLGTALAVAALGAACAAAATLALGSTSLAAGNAPVTSCGVTSLSATRTVDNSGDVLQVVVGSVPAACAGERLTVTLANGSGAPLGSASALVPTGGGTMTFTGFGSVSAASLAKYAYALVGA